MFGWMVGGSSARCRGTTTMGAVAIVGVLTVLASSVGAAISSASPKEGIGRWQAAMERLPPPGKGCFTAAFPAVQWRRAACKPAPHAPYPPKYGAVPLTVGNGDDFSGVAAPGHKIWQVRGSFDFVSPGSSELGQQNGGGPLVPNTFSLQINSNFFATPKCATALIPANCYGWQQFLYSTTLNAVFMEYWLGLYDKPCPAGWFAWHVPATTHTDCYQASPMTPWPAPALTVADLSSSMLMGNACGTGPPPPGSLCGGFPNKDWVTLVHGVGATAAAADSAFDLSAKWLDGEFAVVGDGYDTKAMFSPGTALTASVIVRHGTTAAPGCLLDGFTGETSNLHLNGAPAILGPPMYPTLKFNQTFAAGAPACNSAIGQFDPHLTTFGGKMLYDFQARGDFVMATTGRRFFVQARTVSGAPDWPAMAVNQAIAARVGRSNVALCPPLPTGEPGHLAVNGKIVKLAEGALRRLPGGGDVSLNGGVYLIRGASGDSVQVQPLVTALGLHFMNVTVGLGRWPETVHGLLANAGNNPNAIESRGGVVLTQPFPFTKFYGLYANSWRVPASQDLITAACGGQPESDSPKNLFYASNLDRQIAKIARTTCLADGVHGPAPLDACTVDVAVLGDEAGPAYRNLPAQIIWGKILPPVK